MTLRRSSSLETALRRRIGRRLTIARWAKVAILVTAALVYVGHKYSWVFYAGFVAFCLETFAIMVGEAQRCPMCDASLVIRRERIEDFATECSECGYIID